MSSAVGVAESRAPRPRPSPRLFMLQHLPGEFEICDRPTRSQVMEHHGLPVARCLREAHVARDHRVEDLAREVAVHLVSDLKRDRKSTRLNSSHLVISYAVFC